MMGAGIRPPRRQRAIGPITSAATQVMVIHCPVDANVVVAVVAATVAAAAGKVTDGKMTAGDASNAAGISISTSKTASGSAIVGPDRSARTATR